MTRTRLLAIAAVVFLFVVAPLRAQPMSFKAIVYDHGDDFARLISTDGHSTLFLCFFADRKSLEQLRDGERTAIAGKQLMGRQEAIIRYGIPVVLLKDCRINEERKEGNKGGSGTAGSPPVQEQPSGKTSAGGKDAKKEARESNRQAGSPEDRPEGKLENRERRDDRRDSREEARDDKREQERREEARDDKRERERREERHEATPDAGKGFDESKRREDEFRRDEKKPDDEGRRDRTGQKQGQPASKPLATGSSSNRPLATSPQMKQFQYMLAQQHEAFRAIAMRQQHTTAQPQSQTPQPQRQAK
jgi:hypothetical protein